MKVTNSRLTKFDCLSYFLHMIENDGRDLREYDGRRYEFVFGGDVINDGMYLEVWDAAEPKELILFVVWSDADDSFTFTAYREKLPFALVEQFIQEARECLLPRSGDLKDGN